MHPNLLRNCITIIEPWEHVGLNALGEDVRASKNVAYIAQKVADMDSVLLPVWSTGVLDPEIVVPAINSGYAVVVEGVIHQHTMPLPGQVRRVRERICLH